jgi:3-hydroxybutyryl-CoA dehydrogenase
MNLDTAHVLVVGAGLMGAGIAQVAAQAGHEVALFDTRDGAAEAAKAKLAATLDGLVAKGKLSAEAVAATLARIKPVAALQPADLVIEAIVENLDVKRTLFAELEALLPDEAVIATNTSSISVTALARGMQRPERLVGMHFFNPVPLMKLVEVVSGLGTAPEVAQAVFDLAARWGKTPVHARSTPGFIVNRIARPYYAEALLLLQDRVAKPEVIDACLRAAGFRMGPCELMDLIGHDTNFAVTNSVFAANFFDRRFTPSLVQQELVDAGFLGRKSGRGFYRYPDGAPALPASHVATPSAAQVVVHGQGPVADRFAAALPDAVREQESDWIGLNVDGHQLRLTDGRRAAELARGTAVFDLPLAAAGDLAFSGDAAHAPRGGRRAGPRRVPHDCDADQ